MSSVDIIVVNTTGASLYVTDSRGSDLSGVTKGQLIINGQAVKVASFNKGIGGADHWDWIYFGKEKDISVYQIYMESTGLGKTYLFIGNYDSNASQSNGNPSPFTDKNCWLAGIADGGNWIYTFVGTPS